MKQRLFSGLQPTGIVHIGNYFGAIKNWIALQNDFDALFCIVDLHALTVYQEPEKFSRSILNTIKLYLACGLDPKKATIFIQSHVKEHAELAWILNTITPIAELERMTQYKDKAKQHKENVNVGLFDYPVLMAGDIFLYDGQAVPVGEDQMQHIELARVLAKKFNNKYGQTFIEPKGITPKFGARIMALDDVTKKMSKSAKSEYNYITMSDNATAIDKKIKKAVTDSGSEIIYDPENKPALSNLLTIYHLTTGIEIPELVKRYAGKGYGAFKQDLAQALIDFLTPIQEKMAGISDAEALKIVKDGAKQAAKIAAKKIKEVKEKIGLI